MLLDWVRALLERLRFLYRILLVLKVLLRLADRRRHLLDLLFDRLDERGALLVLSLL